MRESKQVASSLILHVEEGYPTALLDQTTSFCWLKLPQSMSVLKPNTVQNSTALLSLHSQQQTIVGKDQEYQLNDLTSYLHSNGAQQMTPQSLASSADSTMSTCYHAHRSAAAGFGRPKVGSAGLASRLQAGPTSAPYGSLRHIYLMAIIRNPRGQVYFSPSS